MEYTLKDQRNVRLRTINKLDSVNIVYNEPYVLVLFINDGDTNKDTERWLSQIVTSNCGWVVCAGNNCQEWELLVDLVIVDNKNFLSNSIVTTAHPNEDADEVMWFALNLVSFDVDIPKKYEVIFIGKNNFVEKQVKKYIVNL